VGISHSSRIVQFNYAIFVSRPLFCICTRMYDELFPLYLLETKAILPSLSLK
ncbi:hypothetical protein L9F63_013416, partial [Diploptera punctata]